MAYPGPRALDSMMENLRLNPASSSSSATTTITNDLATIRALHSRFKAVQCRNCHIALPAIAVKDHLRIWLAGATGSQPAVISGILCRTCQRYTCIGCGLKPKLGGTNIVTSCGTVNNCCTYGRLFGIWVLLSRYDEVELQLQTRANQNRARIHPTRGYGSGHGTSAGYAEGYSVLADFSLMDFKVQDNDTDKLFRDLLTVLVAFLPSPNGPRSFDATPPKEILSLFRISLVLDRVAALARNDSLGDITSRSKLYLAVLSFVKTAASHPRIVTLLSSDRVSKRRSPGLQTLSDSSSRAQLDFDSSPDGLGSNILKCFEPTIKAAKTLQSLGSQHSREYTASNDKATLEICNRILALQSVLAKHLSSPSSAPSSSSQTTWANFHAANRVTFTDEVLRGHYYTPQFSSTTHSPVGRVPRIVKEIATLSTSLSTGIFLKVAKSRTDVMKALIVGPEGTPYSGGLFSFDIYLPPTYPHSPPHVWLAMPWNRTMAINPNIHADGKVCLSLLNTWPGTPLECWQPSLSTLLQVLTSIQSMIFCSDPVYNEPSSQAPSNGMPGRSFMDPEWYTAAVRETTVACFIWPWVSGELEGKGMGVWKEIGREHWRVNGASVRRCLREWTGARMVGKKLIGVVGLVEGVLGR